MQNPCSTENSDWTSRKARSLMWYRLCEPRKRPDIARPSFSLHVVRCNCAGLFFANAAVLRLLRLVIMEPFRHWLIALAPCYKPLTNCDLAKTKRQRLWKTLGKKQRTNAQIERWGSAATHVFHVLSDVSLKKEKTLLTFVQTHKKENIAVENM